MKKKKILLCVAVTSMIAVTGTVLAINGGLENSSVFATNGEVWYHYAEIAPTPTRHGSKEFWASSTDGCATHQFVNPGVASIDRNFFDNEYFYSLTKEDDRYIAPTSSSPIINGNTVTYGIYPQTVLTDEELVSNLTNDATEQTNGWFLYRGEYYAKVSAAPYYKDNQFDNGTTIEEGTTYWFKCEPITWNVLSDANGEYYILSSVLLDAHCYYDFESAGYELYEYRTINNKKVYHNNYEYSDIRSWLNDEFYNSAFALGNSHIQATTVDNSASTTNSDENTYACDNTQDSVFLPSYQDYLNSSYGFSTDTTYIDHARWCKTTDWAKARGTDYSHDEYGNDYGDYWTRSPSSGDYGVASSVNYIGWVKPSEWGVDQPCVCVRPALSIKIL